MTLARWLQQHSIVGLSGVDTRAITEIVREYGTLTGRIEFLGSLVHIETIQEPEVIIPSKRFVSSEFTLEVLVIDCGVKTNQLRCLLEVGLNITVNHHSVKFIDEVLKEEKYANKVRFPPSVSNLLAGTMASLSVMVLVIRKTTNM